MPRVRYLALTVGYEEDFQGADLVVQAHSGSVVCVETEVGGVFFFANPLDWRLRANDGDPSYQPPDGQWQNPGVECDFGRKDNPIELGLVDCLSQWQPQSPTCDEILLNDSLPNLTCDNRGALGPFLGRKQLEDLSMCPKDGSNCVVHIWYDAGSWAGDNFKFRGECLCKEGTPIQVVSQSGWTPSEDLTSWRVNKGGLSRDGR